MRDRVYYNGQMIPISKLPRGERKMHSRAKEDAKRHMQDERRASR